MDIFREDRRTEQEVKLNSNWPIVAGVALLVVSFLEVGLSIDLVDSLYQTTAIPGYVRMCVNLHSFDLPY